MFVLDHLWQLAQSQLQQSRDGAYAAFGRQLDEMLTPPAVGYYVAHADSPCRRGRAGLAMAIEHARTHNRVVAGWLNPNDGEFYFESVRPYRTRQDAFNAAMKKRQAGIYDLSLQTYVDLTEEASDPAIDLRALTA